MDSSIRKRWARGWLRRSGAPLRVAALGLASLALAAEASAWCDIGTSCNKSWSHRRKLTFNNAAQAENLLGFQVLVVLNASRIDYARTRDDGFDLRFVDANDATLLDYEIERWDEAGSSYVWVRVPQVDASSSTDFIWMYYGNPVAPSLQNPAAVWAGYSMVHHLEEASGQHLDSSSNANHSSVVNVQSQASPLGIIDGADVFAGSHNVDVPDAASLDMADGDSFLVEAWIFTASAGSQMVVSKENTGTGTQGEIQLWTSGGFASFWLNDGTNPPVSHARAGGATNVADSAWHYLAGRWTNGTSTAEIFVDGVSDGSASNALGAIQTATPLVIGQEGDVDRGFEFNGRIDEVRVSKVLRSNNWIRAQNLSMRDSFVSYGAEAAHCCDLAVAETASTITVTGTNRFELRFNRAAGGGIDQLYDVEENPARTVDLAAGTTVASALHLSAIESASTWYNTSQDDRGARIDLLEATPLRTRVRAQAHYKEEGGSAYLAAVTSIADYSVYPTGRLAQRWTRSTTATVGFDDAELDLVVHYQGAGALSSWNWFSQTDGTSPNPGPDDFQLAQIEVASARTDLLSVLHKDWTTANGYQFNADNTHWLTSGGDEAGWAVWSESGPNTLAANASESWDLLTYLKPTTFASNVHAPVTSRASDYRGPSTTTLTAGAGWVDAAESTASDPADVFFNEAEAAYVFDLDPATGLSFAMNGSVTTRHYPFFKIRRWRSLTETPLVTFDADGPGGAAPVALAKAVDYRAAVKPLSRAHFANTLTWHCTIDDISLTNTCTPSGTDLDVGSGGGVSGVDVVPARYGTGALFNANADYVTAPSGPVDFNVGGGAVEFWYQPNTDHDTSTSNVLWRANSANDCFLFEKTGTSLRFRIAKESASNCTSGGTTYQVTVTAANYFWRARDWVHLRTTWSNAFPGRISIWMNGVELNFTTGYSSVSVDNPVGVFFGGCVGVTCPFNTPGHADGIIDEPHVYVGASEPASLAHGGRVGAADEYLADSALSYPLGLARVDGSRRGRYLYFGSDSKFLGLSVNLATAGAGVADTDVVWQYWRGGAAGWATLAVTDGTRSFKQTGPVSWSAPLGWTPISVSGGPDLFYVRAHLPLTASAEYTSIPVERVIKTDILLFQYCRDVTTAAATFAFAVPPTTEVKLQSFAAIAEDSAVLLEWRTGSELQNLGFHLYRAESERGPWRRLTSSLIPGLGSSAVGQAYAYRDPGLVNGTRYFYRLEDVDARGKATSHGPVSAVPEAVAALPGGGPATASAKAKGGSPTCPDWVVLAYGGATGAAAGSLRCTRHGDPESTSLRVLSSDARGALVELRTGGFYALHEAGGGVRVFVPGFDLAQEDEPPSLPVRRALVDAVVGRGVKLGGVRALELEAFKGLAPSALGQAEMEVSWDGTVRAGRRALPARGAVSRGLAARVGAGELAALLPSVFQGERKSAVVELRPLRYEAVRRQLVLSKRLRVRLLFTGRERGESGRGSLGRALRGRQPEPSAEVLGRIYTTSVGLHAVSYEQLFGDARRGVLLSELRLSREGEAVAFHVEPSTSVFGPGSRLYFHADRTASSTDYTGEQAYELSRVRDGLRMAVVSGAPGATLLSAASFVTRRFEVNRFYQPGLLEAREPWLWEAVSSGAVRVMPFELAGVETGGSESARLEVDLQGASESGQAVDHHVSVSVNGVLVGEARFAGRKPQRMSLVVTASLLREGPNELQLASVADTGVPSLVFLDGFTLVHPQRASIAGGAFEGTWSESGAVRVAGVGAPPVVVELGSAGAGARWLTGFAWGGGGVSFAAEAGRTYLVVAQPLAPRVERSEPSTLRAATNQADWLLIGPRALLGAAEPLVQRRSDQGLEARAVSLEEIASEFGHGRPSAEAIRSFLAHAFHGWSRPSPRYVLLLGDSSYDPRNFSGVSLPSPLPVLWTKTSYLWTASDPLLAAVNGEDVLPDLAIGRLPATTLAQAEALVAKLLAWEDSGQGLSGAAALVADNPDLAGDFEWDVEDIRGSFLGGRQTQVLKLSDLGAATRPAIRAALDGGLGFLGYVGHGGAAVWASENVWSSWDADSLLPQSRQPLLLTLNCLNGYFVAPSYESLAESLLKAEGRGAIAAFAPSGLSLDGPAHQYHRALMAELTGGRHPRLGDAVLAAQRSYAEAGLMPELLAIYHLLGDPATPIL